MDTEGVKFIDNIFENIVLSASGCSCSVSHPDIDDIVTQRVVVIVVNA